MLFCRIPHTILEGADPLALFPLLVTLATGAKDDIRAFGKRDEFSTVGGSLTDNSAADGEVAFRTRTTCDLCDRDFHGGVGKGSERGRSVKRQIDMLRSGTLCIRLTFLLSIHSRGIDESPLTLCLTSRSLSNRDKDDSPAGKCCNHRARVRRTAGWRVVYDIMDGGCGVRFGSFGSQREVEGPLMCRLARWPDGESVVKESSMNTSSETSKRCLPQPIHSRAQRRHWIVVVAILLSQSWLFPCDKNDQSSRTVATQYRKYQ